MDCFRKAFTVPFSMLSIKGRGGSGAAATSKMECFVIIVNGFQPLTIITKHSILDVTAALDPPLIYNWQSVLSYLHLISLDHMVEIYSTGCRSNDCSNAESSIKFDGMELSGKSEGINIVVLSYPG